jgi:hydrogenase nickel incorporation protein HypA/HybF
VHELSICAAIASIAERVADGRRVERVRVDIGQLRQVVPETLEQNWAMVVLGTVLEGSVLEARDVPAVIQCRSCGQRTELSAPFFECAACGSRTTDVVGGDELLVTSIDVTAERPA